MKLRCELNTQRGLKICKMHITMKDVVKCASESEPITKFMYMSVYLCRCLSFTKRNSLGKWHSGI